MNKITSVFLGIFLVSQGASAHESKRQEFKHDFTLGLESFHYKYSEETPEHKNFMDYKGMMYGINGAYQLTYKDSFFVRPEARWAYGHTDYSNHWGKDHDQHHIPSMIFEARLLGGMPFKIFESFNVSPYTGIGYRYKWDDPTGTKSKANVTLYKRINKLWYIPLGMRFKYDFTDQWHVQGMAEYDFLIQGKNYSYDKDSIPSPFINKQKKGFGLRGELLIGRQFEKVSLAVGPYINYWKIKESNKILHTLEYESKKFVYNHPVWEPKNTTTELGLKFNVRF